MRKRDSNLAQTHVGEDIAHHMYQGQNQDLCILHQQSKEKFIRICIFFLQFITLHHECILKKKTIFDQVNKKDQLNNFTTILPVEGRALAWDADLAAT